ncbi:unnamed protein product, partial [Prorocentrum cordatum]
MVLKIVCYNAQSADFTRMEEISLQCRSVDIIVVTSTQRHTDIEHDMQENNLPFHK